MPRRPLEDIVDFRSDDEPGYFDSELETSDMGAGEVDPAGDKLNAAVAEQPGIAGQAIRVWGRLVDSGPVPSYDTDQRRWIKVIAYMEAPINDADDTDADPDVATLDIPLTDADGLPWADPSFPPLTVVRRSIFDHDLVNDEANTSESWIDLLCNIRTPMVLGAFTNHHFCAASLRLSREPRPHWILTLTMAQNGRADSDRKRSIMVDILTSGFGIHRATSVEVGVDDTAGHHRRWLIYEQQDFLAVNSKTAAQERRFSTGKVRHNAHPTDAQAWYLSSPDGLVGDTAIFTAARLPACRVYQDPTSNDPNEGAQQEWTYTSGGLGYSIITGSGIGSNLPQVAYYSELETTAAGKHKLTIFKISTFYNERSFYLFSWGLGV